MTTRLYFERGLTPDLSPSSWSAGWNKTSGGVTSCLTRAKRASTLNADTVAGNGSSGHFVATGRYVSGPLKAQTISGNISGRIAGLETNDTDDYTLAVAIKVIKADGTDRGALLAATASDDTSAQPPEFITALTKNRKIRDVSENTSVALSSLAVSDGDRLVVELGYRQGSTSTANGTIVTGTSAGTDHGDDETAGGATADPWIEFDTDITMRDMPTYLGSSSNPADSSGAVQTANPVSVVPPSDMQAGDLVVLIGQERATASTLAISQAGGQTWNSLTAIGTTSVTARVFWCIYNGTWSANPSVSFTGTTCNSAVMHVFRGSGSDSNYAWGIDVAQVELDIAAAATQTIIGQTSLTVAALTVAGWFTADDNTWGSISGTGWVVSGDAQYRNTSGTDQSCTFAHKIQAAAGATGNVAKTQLTLGNDAATTFIVTFKQNEPAGPPPAAVANAMMMMGMGV